jgi:hypothetical protein
MKRVALISSFAAAALAAALPLASQARATVFSAWKIVDVPWGDALNIRKYPASYSRKQSAYPNGAVLSMTGRCTGGVNLLDIQNLPDWKQRRIVHSRWCEVWHDPARDGKYVTGWVYCVLMDPVAGTNAGHSHLSRCSNSSAAPFMQ